MTYLPRANEPVEPHIHDERMVEDCPICQATGGGGGVGPAGPPGPAGPAGAAATVAVGPTTTGAPGTQAAVTNTGTSSAAVFRFTIPAGATGPTGPAGAAGPAGAPGAAGADGVDGISLSIQGSVPTYADLPTDAVAGDCWVVEADGLLYDSDGVGFPPDGAGVPWRGPAGIQGQQGLQGPPGLGITYKGTVATSADLPASATSGDLYIVSDPAPAHGFVWDADTSAWVDAGPVQGPQGVPGPQGESIVGPPGRDGVDGAPGPAGPTAVSADANNTSRLGSDGLIFTPAGATYTLPPATRTTLGGVKVGSGLGVSADGTIVFVPDAPVIASPIQLGQVQIGDGIGVTGGGVISVPVASASVRGSVKVGTGLSVTADGTLSAAATALTPATATTLGGVKVGAGLAVTADGTLSTQQTVVTAAGAAAPATTGLADGSLWCEV